MLLQILSRDIIGKVCYEEEQLFKKHAKVDFDWSDNKICAEKHSTFKAIELKTII